MYNQLRNDVVTGLADLPKETLDRVLRVLDQAAERYEINCREMALATCPEGLPEIAKIYLVCKKIARLSEETLSSYRIILEVFFRDVRKQPGEITTNDIRLWLCAYQQRQGVSDRTMDKYREYITRFFNWALDEGYISCNPAKGVESIQYETKPREALTQVELEYLRKACRTPRELAIIEVLYSTGCRVSELAGLKRSDLDWRELSVHLYGKGRKHRTSWLNAKAEVALKAYLDSRTDDCPYLIVSARKPYRGLTKDGLELIVKSIAQRSGLDKHITPHILRHTTATTALQSGMPVADISKLLGHESIDTTMVYAETSVEDVRAGHKKHIV